MDTGRALEGALVDRKIQSLALPDHFSPFVGGDPCLKYGVVGEAEDLYIPHLIPPERAVPDHHDARPALGIARRDEGRVRVGELAAPLEVGLLLLRFHMFHEPQRADLRANRRRVLGEGPVERHGALTSEAVVSVVWARVRSSSADARAASLGGSGASALAAAECRVARMRHVRCCSSRRRSERQRGCAPASHHQVIARVARVTQPVFAAFARHSRPAEATNSEQSALTAVFSTRALGRGLASHQSRRLSSGPRRAEPVACWFSTGALAPK